MLYEFTQPFVVDGTKRGASWEQADPTLLHDAIAQAIAWYSNRKQPGA